MNQNTQETNPVINLLLKREREKEEGYEKLRQQVAHAIVAWANALHAIKMGDKLEEAHSSTIENGPCKLEVVIGRNETQIELSSRNHSMGRTSHGTLLRITCPNKTNSILIHSRSDAIKSSQQNLGDQNKLDTTAIVQTILSFNELERNKVTFEIGKLEEILMVLNNSGSKIDETFVEQRIVEMFSQKKPY